MTKLWEKGYALDALVEAFTVGNDPALDQRLITFDCIGSLAHAKMLCKIGILSSEEWKDIQHKLVGIIQQAEAGNFVIRQEDEDVHTAVENALGEVGKKLHTARSRNDQIALDLRLFAKSEILSLSHSAIQLIETLTQFAKKYADVPIPGRTHMQRAMPSSLGLWAGALMESLVDDLAVLKNSFEIVDQCPLGSAAGYGVSLPIDREYTSQALGFAQVQNNVLYVSNSRGKFEAIIVHALAQVMSDLSKLSTDLIFFSLPEIGYLTLPEAMCSGSSLMPQKRNPDLLELIRAKAASVTAHLMQHLNVTHGLPSGYHRDFQETKGPFMQVLEVTSSSLQVMQRLMESVKVNVEKCIGAFSSDLFATDAVLELTGKGVPFREAYKQVAVHLNEVEMPDPQESLSKKSHLGATGNLGLELATPTLSKTKKWIEAEETKWKEKTESLMKEMSP